MISNSIYHFRVALRNMFRNGLMSMASITTIVVGLFIAGLVVILIANVNYLMEQVENELLIKVFLERDLTEDSRNLLEERIRSHPLVNTVRYIDKEEGKAILEKQFGEEAYVLEGLDLDRILWDGFEITVHESAQIVLVARALSGFEGIEDIIYGKEYISDLLRIANTVRTVGTILALVIGIASTFVIFNTVRMTVLMRQDEIAVMRYVGASNWFIRWPFILEGWLIGLIGASLSAGALIYLYRQISEQFVQYVSYLALVPIDTVTQYLLLALTIGGSLLGILGSTLSMRKFLKL